MINKYVELHRVLGFKYRIQNCLLQNFSKFARKQGDSYVRSKTIIEWASLAPSRAQKRNRLLTIRRFAIAMKAEDERYEIPAPDIFGRYSSERRIPHILSSKELKLLLTETLKLKPKNSIRPITYATLFSLLASTGLRISEALALTMQDVTNDGLIIRATKFRKDRLVPLHRSTRNGIQRYLNFRIKFGGEPKNSFVFISNSGGKLPYPTVVRIFLELIRKIGLRDGPGSPGICIHDLRHRFAVKSLEQCKSNDISVSRHMAALSTYLGHTHISDTYWYLHATPLLMKRISNTQEKFNRRKHHD